MEGFYSTEPQKYRTFRRECVGMFEEEKKEYFIDQLTDTIITYINNARNTMLPKIHAPTRPFRII
jgi:hypothetical protein